MLKRPDTLLRPCGVDDIRRAPVSPGPLAVSVVAALALGCSSLRDAPLDIAIDGGGGSGDASVAADSSGNTDVTSPSDAYTPVSTEQGHSRIAVGLRDACFLRDGKAFCWGDNERATRGIGSEYGDNTGPGLGGDNYPSNPVLDERKQPLAGLVDLALAGDHACAVVGATGRVLCWGWNDTAEAGRNDGRQQLYFATPLEPELTGVVSIAAGLSSTCAIQTGGKVYCWGSPALNELTSAVPNTVRATAPTEIPALFGSTAIALGDGFGCAVSGGAVRCWGLNDTAQVGTAGSSPPVCTVTSGREVPCFGTPQPVPNVGHAVQITAGRRHACALDDAQQVLCWGANEFGQCGRSGPNGGAPPSSTGTFVALQGATQVSAGADTTCALKGGQALCWGSNAHNELARGDGPETSTDTAPHTEGLPARTLQEPVQTLEGLRRIATGWHSCAVAYDPVTKGEQVWCWGWIGPGDVGVFATTNRQVAGALPIDPP